MVILEYQKSTPSNTSESRKEKKNVYEVQEAVSLCRSGRMDRFWS